MYVVDSGADSMAIVGVLLIGLIATLISCAVWVLICWAVGRSKKLPTKYMWFGLLGWIGLIIVACQKSRVEQTPPVYAPYTQVPPVQPPYQQPYQPVQQPTNNYPPQDPPAAQ